MSEIRSIHATLPQMWYVTRSTDLTHLREIGLMDHAVGSLQTEFHQGKIRQEMRSLPFPKDSSLAMMTDRLKTEN